MMKFPIKSLITLFVTSSAFLLTPLSSYAQVKMNILTPVVKSCQEDAPENDYYKRIDINFINAYFDVARENNEYKNGLVEKCIHTRYYYSLILSKLPWLASAGEMIPRYPNSVAVAALANDVNFTKLNLLDCIVSQDSFSKECNATNFYKVAPGYKIRTEDIPTGAKTISNVIQEHYPFYVCPYCVLAHNNIVSRQEILAAFIQWFLRQEKPQRRELMSILGDDDKAYKLRKEMHEEADKAVYEYREALKRVEQQGLERRRQELLGQ